MEASQRVGCFSNIRRYKMLKVFLLYLVRKYGWLVGARIAGEALVRGVIKFHLEAKDEAQKGVFEAAGKVVKDGHIKRDEVVYFLRSFKPAIPGWLDDLIIEALCMMLLSGSDFDYGTDEKPELFEAFSVAVGDGVFCNRELGTILLEVI